MMHPKNDKTGMKKFCSWNMSPDSLEKWEHNSYKIPKMKKKKPLNVGGVTLLFPGGRKLHGFW